MQIFKRLKDCFNGEEEEEEESEVVIKIDKMKREHALKIYEIEWQDHFQTRKQTWQALQVAGLLTVAIIGFQWSTKSADVIISSSILLIFISLFGMQLTKRHRNSTEITKFQIITKIQKKVKFKVKSGLKVPEKISYWNIICGKSNTSIFLLRMQFMIHLLGWFLLGYGILLKF